MLASSESEEAFFPQAAIETTITTHKTNAKNFFIIK